MIVNGHSDFGLKIYYEFLQGNPHELIKTYLPQLRSGNVKFVILQAGGDFSANGIDFGDTLTVLKTLSFVRRKILENPKEFRLITRGEDFETILQNDQIGILLSIEGARCIDSDLLILDVFYDLGLRSLALTHNFRNQFGDGCKESSNGGLSNSGRKLIDYLNNRSIILDLVHLSNQSFWDAIELLKRPPIVSHSNVRTIREHERNLSDDQILAIGEKKGVIGLNFYGLFVDNDPNKATLERLIDHLDKIVELIGIDYVGLGPDFYKYFMPDYQCVDNIDDESGLSKLSESLTNRGYSDSEIKKIYFSNFIRVFKKNII